MKERPLLLVKDLRQKAVAGLMTQHRNIIGLDINTSPNTKARISDKGVLQFRCPPENMVWRDIFWGNKRGPKSRHCKPVRHPYAVGDLLYQQEPYQIDEDESNSLIGTLAGQYLDDSKYFEIYDDDFVVFKKLAKRKFPYRKSSAGIMYKSLARYWYEVTAVRVEQVQDISAADCVAEGCPSLNAKDKFDAAEEAIAWFHDAWNSIYGPDAWDRNDWNFVTQFKRIERSK